MVESKHVFLFQNKELLFILCKVFWFFRTITYAFVLANKTDYVDYMSRNFPKTFLYPDFAKDFTAEFYNATEWAEIFANSGAK